MFELETIEKFSDIVFNAGYASPVRTPRGAILAARPAQERDEKLRRGRGSRRSWTRRLRLQMKRDMPACMAVGADMLVGFLDDLANSAVAKLFD